MVFQSIFDKNTVEKLRITASQVHAERMLQQQEDIPTEWEEFLLLFAGTTWCRADGASYIPYLYYGDDEEWHLSWINIRNSAEFPQPSRLVYLDL